MKAQVAPVTHYPYPPGAITTRQAVALIAAVVYPRDDESAARKRVRERLRYARDIDALSLSDTLNAPRFFDWALRKYRDWAALAQVENLPLSSIVTDANYQLNSTVTLSDKLQLVLLPGDPAKLQEEFVRIENERQRLDDEVALLKRRIAALETEIADWRKKDRELRTKRSAAGKKGGRGKTI